MSLSKQSHSDDGFVPIENLSTELRKILDEGKVVTEFRGSKKCMEELDSGKFKEGHIILMFRSFRRAMGDGSGNAVGCVAAKMFPEKYVMEKGQAKLADWGQSKRDFAYVHTAVYVGALLDSDGRKVHMVIENAGGFKKQEGAFLQCRDINTSFGDYSNEESEFKIIKPGKCHATAQRAMAAYHDGFKYQYSLFGFNCESFTSACAGLYDHDQQPDEGSSSKQTKPDAFRRVVEERTNLDKNSKIKEAARKAEVDRNVYVERLEKGVFLENQDKIDGGKYQLSWSEDGVTPEITIKN